MEKISEEDNEKMLRKIEGNDGTIKCPNCNHTRFSVCVKAYQEYDGELKEWGSVSDISDNIGDSPFTCYECGEEFSEEELKKYNEVDELN